MSNPYNSAAEDPLIIMEGAKFSGSIDMGGKKAGQLPVKHDATVRPTKTAGGAF